jgi:hypothetical protein
MVSIPTLIKEESLAINVGMDTIEQLVTRTKYHQGHQEVYSVSGFCVLIIILYIEV